MEALPRVPVCTITITDLIYLRRAFAVCETAAEAANRCAATKRCGALPLLQQHQQQVMCCCYPNPAGIYVYVHISAYMYICVYPKQSTRSLSRIFVPQHTIQCKCAPVHRVNTIAKMLTETLTFAPYNITIANYYRTVLRRF